jgi:hypothetical protein
MTKQSHHTDPFPRQLREEAFDLYCTGLTRPHLQAELARRHGTTTAPSLATIKRWAQADSWKQRRDTIWQAVRQRRDADRALLGSEYLDKLHQLRHTVLEALHNLSFSTAEGALFGLAALERVIERQIFRMKQDEINAAIKPILSAQIDQLRSLRTFPLPKPRPAGSPGEGLMPTDEKHDPNMSS